MLSSGQDPCLAMRKSSGFEEVKSTASPVRFKNFEAYTHFYRKTLLPFPNPSPSALNVNRPFSTPSKKSGKERV
jgi:hypothetical protein